ncbi:MAG: substrate-binding domain-containing protein [Gammaproteobacteria bacterium]|nr:substrate-binding domain-containing protein [Gammaproteobacteria bacterium]
MSRNIFTPWTGLGMPAFRRVQLGILVLALGLFAGGCSPDNASEDAPAKPTIALVMKSLANEFFVTMADAAEAHQGQHEGRYDLIVNGIKNESDLAAQVALVEQMMGLGVDAIVIAPADSKALVPVLARARAAGIQVVNIDNRLDAEVLAEYDLAIPFIGPDNRKGARDVAEFVLGRLTQGANVVILEGVTSAHNAIERRRGFEDAIAAAGANLLTMQSASWDQTKAAEVTAAILVSHPETQVILAANDNMALGAASAVAFAGLEHDVTVVGFDNISAVHPLLEDGRIAATVEQYGDQFAVNGIELALDMIAGQADLSDRETPIVVVTAADLAAQEPTATTQ